MTWLLFSAVLVLFAVQAWRGRLTRPVRSYVQPVADYFSSNPALIYALTAVLLVAFAQFIDKGWLLIGDYFGFLNPEIDDWALWSEEVLEFIAAIEFLAASLLFTGNDPKILS